jgi:hypothetical protein
MSFETEYVQITTNNAKHHKQCKTSQTIQTPKQYKTEPSVK